jgi:NADH:ubiquinone oxidoreductase subunit 2 (subunit N)
MELKDQLLSISESVTHLLPELILIASLVITLVLGLFLKKQKQTILHTIALITYLIAIVIIIQTWPKQPISSFWRYDAIG